MTDFFAGQMDYISFFYGLAFMLLAAVCYVMMRQKSQNLPWIWLGLFGLAHGLHEWLNFFVFLSGDDILLRSLIVFLLALSYLLLAEFGRAGLVAAQGKGPGRKVYAPLLLTALAGGLAGVGGFEAAVRYVIGATGGFWAMRALYLTGRKSGKEAGRWLTAAAAAVGMYAVATAVSVPPLAFPPASWVNREVFFHIAGFPVMLVRGLLTLVIAASLWAFSRIPVREADFLRPRHVFRPVAAILAVVAAGWVLTQFAGNVARDQTLKEANLYVNSLSIQLVRMLEGAEHEAMQKASSPEVIRALQSEAPADLQKVYPIISTCRNSRFLDSDLPFCYLVDGAGRTIASCNRTNASRNDNESPFVRDLMRRTGGPSGARISGVRGYYFLDKDLLAQSYYAVAPVKDEGRRTIGFVVVREPLLDFKAAIARHPFCFLIDPNGVVFLSSRSDMLLSGLWPIEGRTRRELAESGLFGAGPFAPLLPAEIEDGQYTSIKGERVLVTRRHLGSNDWSLVLMTPIREIRIYRIFAIFATFVFSGLIVSFFGALHFTRDSSAQVALSERRHRSLVEGSPNCVVLFDREGKCVTINRSGLDLLGRREEDVIGRRLDELWYFAEDVVPGGMIGEVLEGKRAVFNAGNRRPDGRPVEWSAVLNPVLDPDGVIRNFVGIFVDVTERTEAETELRRYHEHLEEMVRGRTAELSLANERLNEMNEALRVSEERFRSLFDFASDSIFLLEPSAESRPVIVDANVAACATNGYSREEMIGRPVSFLDTAESARKLPEIIDGIMSGKAVTFEVRHVHKDGHDFPLEVSAQLITLAGRSYILAIERDISERKQTEERIRQSEQRYKNLVELTTDIIYISDRDGNQTFMNDAGFEILGYEREDVLGKPFINLIHPDDREKTLEKRREMIEKGVDVFSFENRYITKGGLPIDVLHNVKVIRDEEGRVIGGQGIARDISARKKMEESLFLFSKAVQETMDGVQITDLNGNIVYSNRAVEEIYGFSGDELAGRHVGEMNVDPAFAEETIIPALKRYGRWDGELLVRHKSGRQLPVWLTTSVIRDSEGNPLAMVGVVRDITERRKVEEELERHREHLVEMVEERTVELRTAVQLLTNEINVRKQAEETLKRSEERFRRLSLEFHTLLDAMPDTLILLSPALEVMWANKAAAEGIGRTADEVAGRHCYSLWYGRSEPCDDCYALRSYASGCAEHSQLLTPAGRLIEAKAYPIKDEEDRVANVIVVLSDITEKTALQSEAMRASHLASLGELAAGVAHEINNPINGIINYAQILANRLKEERKENDIAFRIIREGDRIAGIVRSLLSFARERKEEKIPALIQRIMNDTVTLTETQIRKDGIRLTIDIPGDLPEVVANPQQIEQVFLNIISNARYALNQKYPGVHEDKTLDIAGETVMIEDVPYVRVTFRDSGTGIPPEVMDKVMNPFFSTKPGGHGTGLGLSISHGIVRDHKGRLLIESADGEYTIVRIDLPVRRDNGA